ncbi:hypothetical protein G7048_15510 [Diaphorobacter sp. HDW4B]|uniref:hypothetical protein n=1 Tax=Diaphorobacter sp. HDW4B TaxID=2714925 RepID=UPI00140D21E8|nr:hypothetical protein [Diaphorobacter sp. HDW4B]QIL71636.1 hypothetical protein G7048_15510 [Diaphorobacter sp. HDW4B]
MSLATLAEIGIKALRLQEAIDKKRAARHALDAAYSTYKKRRHGGSGVRYDRVSDEYSLMLMATDREHSMLCTAKYELGLAQRSLERACKRAQKELKAGASAEAAVRRIMEKAA